MAKENQIIQMLQTTNSLSAREITDKLYGKTKHQSIVFGRLQKMETKGIAKKDESTWPYRWSLVNGSTSTNATNSTSQSSISMPNSNRAEIIKNIKTVTHDEKHKKIVALISCTSSKRGYEGYFSEARYLYDTSPFFPTSLAYSEIIADEIFVISAEYYLVALDRVIEGYNKTLNDFNTAESKEWGKVVMGQLSERFVLSETEFLILAGEKYYRPLLQNNLPEENVKRPLRGVDMFHWYAAQKELCMCARLHKLFNSLPRLHWDAIDEIDFDNGIYIVFEDGEAYYGMNRIVRVGTHNSNGRLRQRLKDHFIRENKDGSIFRKNIGKALLNKNKNPYLEIWSMNSSNKDEIIRKAGSKYNPVFQQKVEKSVSDYMREHISFVCFPVATMDERLRLEEGIIALLNRSKDFSASLDWRGRFSPECEIAQSGLWLKKGLDGVPLTENEYASIEAACSPMRSERQ